MIDLLLEGFVRNASDVHIAVNYPPSFRINGQIVTKEAAPVLTAEDTKRFFDSVTDEGHRRFVEDKGHFDYSVTLPGGERARLNVYKQMGNYSIVARLLPNKIPSIAELSLPKILGDWALKGFGLILVCGPAGTGKSTTLAALVDKINAEKAGKIITLEDPVEYIHSHNKCLVEQREYGRDFYSFSDALEAALRQDPNAIMVGEMRDAATMSTAVSAAETGHLVLATLHAGDCTQAIRRIIDSFPPVQQQQIKSQLAGCIQGVIAQRLLPRSDILGRVPATEIMVANHAIRNVIREGRFEEITRIIPTNGNIGMHLMDSSLAELVRKRYVTKAEAEKYAIDKPTFASYMTLMV